MSDLENYTDILKRNPDERLAWLAHSVRTPFTDINRNSDNQSDRIYALMVRNQGEFLAAQAVFYDEPPLSPSDILKTLIENVKDRTDQDSERFRQDELAIAHAAMVYKVCVSKFDTCLTDLE